MDEIGVILAILWPFKALQFGKISVQTMRIIRIPLFGQFSRTSCDFCESDYDSHKSRDDRPNSLKSGVQISRSSNRLKIAGVAPNSTILGRN